MSAGTFLSFAYGSNMLSVRLRQRCPSAKPVGVAELHGYGLRWHKRSNDGSGKCDIAVESATDGRVLGVLYEIDDGEKEALDEAEGFGQGYEEIDVQVVLDGKGTKAKAYRATKIDAKLKPFTWYRAFVIAGAKEHALPKDYIDRLVMVDAIEDTNRVRHDRNMRLIPDALK